MRVMRRVPSNTHAAQMPGQFRQVGAGQDLFQFQGQALAA